MNNNTQSEQLSEIQDILEYLDTVLYPIISIDYWSVYSKLHDMISMLPSTQSERKKGEWIVDEKRFGGTERHCSLCGAVLEGDDWKWRNNNYCYHCGAKMVTE